MQLRHHFARNLEHVWLLLKRLAAVMLAYTICRLAFFYFNRSYFSSVTDNQFLKILFAGLRFDVATVIYLNAVVIVLHLLPLAKRYGPGYQRLLRFVFLISNAPWLLSCTGDIIYFRFIGKRSTADVFSVMSTGTDFIRILPQYIKDYYFVFVIWLLLVVFLDYCFRRTAKSFASKTPQDSWAYFFGQLVVALACAPLLTIGARGGFQLKPISIISAGEHVPAGQMPLVLNSAFTILKTIGKLSLKERFYFSDSELKNIYSPIHPAATEPFKALNVVVIILESFSREFVGSLTGSKTYTPFLDSIIQNSLVFEHAYANSKNSIEGIPAILAGVPTLMRSSYGFSQYGSNHVTSFANALKLMGYSTAFYHGGNNGTMKFDVFTRIAGFDRYMGRSEYENETGHDGDWDGHWGIWDEEFFQFAAKDINTLKTPFVVSLFSLTSHHPYRVPDRYLEKFSTGQFSGESTVHQSIRYADFALESLFKTISTKPWFKDTLFVIAADHTAEPEDHPERNTVSMYQIPILFYRPDGSLKGRIDKPFQQIDILPTALDYLNYPHSFFSLGTSAFDPTPDRFAVAYLTDFYQLVGSKYVLHSSGEDNLAFYDLKEYTADTAENLMDNKPQELAKYDLQLRAIVQTYNAALIKNQMGLPNER